MINLPEPEFAKSRARTGKTTQPGGLTTARREVERCPNDHPVWNLYYKPIPGTTDTIIGCRACDQETAA